MAAGPPLVPRVGSIDDRWLQTRVEDSKYDPLFHYRSQHVLYGYLGRISLPQARTVISWYIHRVLSVISAEFIEEKDLNGKFAVNIPTKRDGTPVGCVYVWIVDPRVFQVIAGRNPDGSPRQIVEQVEKEIDSNDPWYSEIKPGSNWADLSEEVVTPLPPLIGSLVVPFNGEEIDFDLLPARVDRERYLGVDPSCLFCSSPVEVAGWLNNEKGKEELRLRFAKYDVEGHTKVWPRVVVKVGEFKNLKFFVKFSPGTKESIFVQLMTMKQEFERKDADGVPVKDERHRPIITTLVFNMAILGKSI